MKTTLVNRLSSSRHQENKLSKIYVVVLTAYYSILVGYMREKDGGRGKFHQRFILSYSFSCIV